ncbi:MAG TPA: RluA family pseudouridine synthase [Thermoanaerobaculia bacterium]|nr:RluA family pseudouridine synthase [Thermoanaerobaculia bacterium]
MSDEPRLRTFRADRGDARGRLDRVLMRHLADRPEVTRAQVQAWIAGGLVRINGGVPAKPASRVALADEVEVVLPPPPLRRQPQAQEMPLSVLYEDEHLLALEKPPGLVVHPAPGHREGTLINALLWRAREWGEGQRPGLVSRLDRDTSGVLMVTKTPAAHAALARALKHRSAEKEYLAVVYGRTPGDRGRIELKIDRDPADLRRRIASKTAGRDSVTLYELLGEGGGLSLLRCRLLTGRTHQIRVHLQAHGLPLVGDPLYGEPRWKGIGEPALAAACRDFPRQALHAWRLAFVHPATGERLEIVAPLPDDLAGLLAAARLQGDTREPPARPG